MWGEALPHVHYIMWSDHHIALSLIQFEEDNYRVFFLNMDSNLARRVLCTVSAPHHTPHVCVHTHAAVLVDMSLCMHASLLTVYVRMHPSCSQVCACMCPCTHMSMHVHVHMQAYRRGLTHPHYVWITYGWYQDRWWSADVSSLRVDCTDQEMVRQVHRALALQLLPEGHDPNAMTDTGLVSGTRRMFHDAVIYIVY